MAIEPKKIQNRLVSLLIIVALIVGVWVVYQDVSKKDSTENPFEYSVEKFARTDSADICYSEIESVDLGDKQLTAIAAGSGGKLYVTGENALTVLENKQVILSSALPVTPGCIAVDINGDIYTGLTDHVGVYSKDGTLLSMWKTISENSIITSIAVGENDVFVADAGQRVVLRFDKSGELIRRIGEKDESRDIPGFVIPSPYFDVALDGDGFLWAVNPGRHLLQNFTFDGDLRAFWGNPSFHLSGFAGCCNPTHFAILSDGSFVTSEKGIPRVKVFDAAGQFLCVVAGPEQFEKDTVGLDVAADESGQVFVLDPKRNKVRVFRRKETT
ncbi:hypothetical protein JW935_17380 [candidate division KSB1 bacterium]|nr:hypothetical protein [candidate division KSB1 bacterium]